MSQRATAGMAAMAMTRCALWRGALDGHNDRESNATPSMTATVAERALTIDVISDVVCPWCFIGRRRLGAALAQLKADEPRCTRS